MGEVRGRAEASGAICVNKPGVCKAGIIWSRFLGFCPAGVWGGCFLLLSVYKQSKSSFYSWQVSVAYALFSGHFYCAQFF